ncbi:MAG: aldehyde dehydrogenase family protein [Pseudomonadota bacterium]
MAALKSYWQNYIDGAWCDGGAGRIAVTDPATGEALAEAALADAADIDRAVAAAARVHGEGTLSAMRPFERGRMVQAIGRAFLARRDEIAEVLTLEQGKPLWEARLEVEGAAKLFEYYGNQAATVEGQSIPLGAGYVDYTVYEPYGVTAHIIPWNYPLDTVARSLAPALATGNTAVVKTPELTPLSSTFFVDAAAEAGFPAGAVNILSGLGREAGAALAAHPGIGMIVFTGSVASGTAVAHAAAENTVPAVLELGGKSAAVVHADADLDAFESDIRYGAFFNAGQVCSALTRVVVDKSIAPELTDRAAAIAKSLSLAPGIELPEAGDTMGPLVSEAQRDKALAMVSAAEAEGARVVAGGRRPNRPGAFMEPTILAGVTPDMVIAREEVFGPVLSILEVSSEAEAIAIANGTGFGLAAGVFTRDLDRASRTAGALKAGQVYVNEWYAGGIETPFGGYGKSGYGREKGRQALWNYVQTKNVAIRIGR